MLLNLSVFLHTLQKVIFCVVYIYCVLEDKNEVKPNRKVEIFAERLPLESLRVLFDDVCTAHHIVMCIYRKDVLELYITISICQYHTYGTGLYQLGYTDPKRRP